MPEKFSNRVRNTSTLTLELSFLIFLVWWPHQQCLKVIPGPAFWNHSSWAWGIIRDPIQVGWMQSKHFTYCTIILTPTLGLFEALIFPYFISTFFCPVVLHGLRKKKSPIILGCAFLLSESNSQSYYRFKSLKLCLALKWPELSIDGTSVCCDTMPSATAI